MELDRHNKIKPTIQHIKKAEQKIEFKFVGNMRYRKGLTLFKFNTETGILDAAKIKEEVSVTMNEKIKKKHKVIYEKDCWYLWALNMNNAERKIKNIYKQLEKEKKDVLH